MLSEIVKEMDAIYDLSGFVATLDIILSLATVVFLDALLKNDGITSKMFFILGQCQRWVHMPDIRRRNAYRGRNSSVARSKHPSNRAHSEQYRK